MSITIYTYREGWPVEAGGTSKTPVTYFDVSLTVHLSLTLANDQLDAQIFDP